jgi:hypothetical protein
MIQECLEGQSEATRTCQDSRSLSRDLNSETPEAGMLLTRLECSVSVTEEEHKHARRKNVGVNGERKQGP